MKYQSLAFLLLYSTLSAVAQDAVLKIDFENRDGISTMRGVQGKALDLGDVADRYAFGMPNPLQDDDSFTVTVWVNGAPAARSAYDVISSLTMIEPRGTTWKPRVMRGIPHIAHGTFNGWRIGMQENGAWCFTARGDNFTYAYEPTSARQSIRDGRWHLLGVTYDRQRSELRFYYDGEPVAIYHAPDLTSMVQADTLVIGNTIDSDHDYRIKQWDSFYGQIDDIVLFNRALTQKEIAGYYQEITGKTTANIPVSVPETLKVTAFNIFHGGNETGKDIGPARVLELLKRNNADVFTLVETYGSGEEIADALGYHFYLISTNLSIMSRYPITGTHQVFRSFNSGGAEITLPGGQRVNVFAIWLKHLPEYKRSFFQDADIDLAEFLKEEEKTRGAEMRAILEEIGPFLAQSKEVPVILAGDFNSGSHLDWTKATARLHNGYVVPWPVSTMAAKAGLTDTYRTIHPDPLKSPAVSWSLHDNSPSYIKDRIDYIYYKGARLRPLASETIDSHPVSFPSDHAGVSTLFGF